MRLFPPQKEVIDNGLLDGKEHCFLNMATSSGKTYLAEMAIDKVVSSGYKAIYITPLRALAEQQYNRWKARFPQYKIGVFTGETIQKSAIRGSYQSAQIYIMTPERLDACMRNWRSHWSWIPDVSLLVVDEFHILGQPQRGPRLEGTITRILRLNPFVRIIALSATIPNAEELSDWVRGASFSSQWRQIPLQKKIVRFSVAKDKPNILLAEIQRCITDGGQSLIFCNSRSRVQSIADYLNAHGIKAACHHAGLVSEKRIETEQNFKKGILQALVSTSTLEMGLNLPARQVIIYDSYSFSETGFSQLPVWSFIQRAGRAGRPGLDDSGEVVLMLPKWVGGADKYIYEECEPVLSQLTAIKSMSEQILIEVYAGFSRTREELTEGFLPLTLYKKQHREVNINGTINKLVLSELLIEKDNEDSDGNTDRLLSVSLLGRLAVKLMFSPATINLIKDAYSAFDKLYLFDLLLLATLSEDCSPVLQTNYEEMDTLCEIVQSLPSSLIEITIEKLKKKLPDCPGTLRILSGIKMAAICFSLTNEKKADEIGVPFNVYSADIHMLQDSVVRLLLGITAITTAIEKSTMGEEAAEQKKHELSSTPNLSSMLANMLQYEISSELVGLTQIRGIGGKTAKRLSQHGYSTIRSLAKAELIDLARINGVGKKLAASILEQAQKLVHEKNQEVYTEERITQTCIARDIKSSIDPYRLRRSLELTVKGHEGNHFYVVGGREDHIIITQAGIYTCDCLDFRKNGWDCKHILCVKRALCDNEVCRMVKKIKEDKNHSIREALPSLWYSLTASEKE